jgi:molecular chaperone DnaK
MEFGKGVFEVKATGGDTQLGGTDMNQRLFDYLADHFGQQAGIDVRADRKAAARVLEAAEIAKIELSTATTARVSLPYLGAVKGEPHHLDIEVTRTDLERLVRPVIERCRGPVEQALHDAGIGPRDIDRLVFVGGPTRMPAVRSYFQELLGRTGGAGVDPMECVACGAAIQEVGKELYAQTSQAAPQPRPDVGAATGAARPSGSGPRGRVVDAEYTEAKKS